MFYICHTKLKHIEIMKIELKNKLIFHPKTNGGRSLNEAKMYIEDGDLWRAYVILRGLGLAIDSMLKVESVVFDTYDCIDRRLISPRISVVFI